MDAYVGSNAKHLAVYANDEVLVLAWADKGKTAIAYSPECNRLGWVPANILKKNAEQNVERPGIWVAKYMHPTDTKPAGVDDGCLTWEKGHYILTCKVKTDKIARKLIGVGINVATGEFGEFDVWNNDLQKVR